MFVHSCFLYKRIPYVTMSAHQPTQMRLPSNTYVNTYLLHFPVHPEALLNEWWADIYLPRHSHCRGYLLFTDLSRQSSLTCEELFAIIVKRLDFGSSSMARLGFRGGVREFLQSHPSHI